MRKTLLFVVAIGAVSLLTASTLAWSQARQSQPAPAGQPSIDDVLKSVRADLQGERADIVAKNITLTSEQAAKFWPVFQQYQVAQNVIMDEQFKSVQKYAESYQTLDDAGALALMNAHLERDTRMVTLRQKWLGEFQKVLPARLAARVMQIDRRLSLVHQIQISSQIPLVH